MSVPNLIMTPHIGGATEETIERHSTLIADEIERFLDGKPLQHAVDANVAMARGR
jgi:D-3-phosphoglycerate dehydrogenase